MAGVGGEISSEVRGTGCLLGARVVKRRIQKVRRDEERRGGGRIEQRGNLEITTTDYISITPCLMKHAVIFPLQPEEVSIRPFPENRGGGILEKQKCTKHR